MVRQPIDEHGGGGENRLPVLSTRAADAFSEHDGTIVLRIRAGSSLDVSLTGEVTRAHIELARGRKCPVLVDVRGLVSMDRESRELAAGAEVAAVTSRLAIVVGNPVSRILGNFFIRVTSPSYPTRLFVDEGLARAWLREGQ